MPDLQARDLKLIQYLNEAYGKEKQLETALEAHIAMTSRAPYRKRLQQHLRETKAHGRDVQRRIKQLGGSAEEVTVPGPDAVTEAATRAVELARKGLAAMQGPVHVLRGTGEQEKLLKNAKTEYQDEAEEIATYTAIETLAQIVGDRETAQLAKRIRREEERMRDFLGRQINQLTKAVATEEIPAAERSGGRRRRRRASSSTSRSTGRRSTSRSSGRRSTSRSTGGRSTSRSTGGRSTSRSSGRSASKSGGRSTSRSGGTRRSSSSRSSSGGSASRSRSSSSRSGGAKSGASRSGASSRSRSGGSTSRSSASRSSGSRSSGRSSSRSSSPGRSSRGGSSRRSSR